MDKFYEFLKVLGKFPEFDLLYFIITVYFLMESSKKGFVLSLLSSLKWILAYLLTLYLFPKVKPFFEGYIDSEYVLDIVLGVGLFVIIIFIILLINKGIGRAVSYSGLGKLDKIFGFFLGFVKAYVFSVLLFSGANLIYDHKKWALNLEESFTFSWVEKGSNYLIRGFPNKKEYENTKNKIQQL